MTESFLNVPYVNFFRLLLITVCWLLIAALTDNVLAETISRPPVLDITFKDNLISAELVDVPLIDVLQRIKQRFGFKMHFYGDLSELITLSFTDMPLGKCLRQLTANHSLSVAFMPTKPSEQNTAKQIAEIWVLSRSTTPQTMNTASRAPVTPAPDNSDNGVKSNEDSSGLPSSEQLETVPVDPLPNSLDAEKTNQGQAVKNLSEIGGPASIAAMVDLLANVENKDTRQLLINEISSIQNEESTQVLGQVLQREPDPEIRKIVVRALGQRKNDSAARALLEQALNDDDGEVKALADQLLTQ